MKGIKDIKNWLRALIIVLPIVLLAVISSGYKEEIIIEEIYPSEIALGEDFNVSIVGSGFEANDVIYINNQACDTTFGNAEWITCSVNSENYQDVQHLEVQVIRKIRNKAVAKSNIREIEIN